jgi:hypothetical protein
VEEGVMVAKQVSKAAKAKTARKRRARTANPPPNGQPSDFDDFPGSNTPNTEIHKIRLAITAMRKSLFEVGGVTAGDYKTIIRIQKKDSTGASTRSADCGCGCS